METFKIWENLGHYPFMWYEQGPLEELSKEIGLGPSLFLMTTKSVAWFFLFLTVINIPIYLFFHQSNQTADCDMNNFKAETLQECFDKVSLGSMGQNEVACSTLNFARNRKINLSCSTQFAKLTEIKFMGLTKSNQSTCTRLNDAKLSDKSDQFENKCYINNIDSGTEQYLFTEEQKNKFLRYYDNNCLNRSKCTIPLTESIGWPKTGKCMDIM